MTKAIRIHAHGGPDVMRWENVPHPEPGMGEVLLRHDAIGLNYIDVYFRTGLYKTQLPAILGQEGAGVVIACGPEVHLFQEGDRVAYAGGPIGAYATERVLSADRMVKIPDEISSDITAAMMLQGMTAHYLLHRTRPVRAGDIVLIHAAAGGVGLILCQWAKHLGATVIGIVSTPAKAQLAQVHGADHVIVGYETLAKEVKRLTGGVMASVVYDSVGRDTFAASLDCLAPLGMMVSYGNASGPVGAVDVGLLGAKGSLFLTRPGLATYTATRTDLTASADALFGVVKSGVVTINLNQRFALQDAPAAHQALESRQTTGSTVLVP